MSDRSLPPELYSQILSNLASSTWNLYNCLFVSRNFCSLAKAILYHHVTIETYRQRQLLKQVNQEDKQRVRKVSVIGDGAVEIEDFGDHIDAIGECQLGGECVEDLLTGRLLDIKVIEVLHVWNVHEHPPYGHWTQGDDPVGLKVASKLRELSIWNHQGGSMVWNSFIRKENVPNLRRLVYHGVSHYREVDDPDEWLQEPVWDGRREGQLYWEKTLRCLSEDEDEGFPTRTPYSQLEALVGRSPKDIDETPNFPFSIFLATIMPGTDSEDTALPPQVSNVYLVYAKGIEEYGFERAIACSLLFAPQDQTRTVQLFLSSRPFSVTPENFESVISFVESNGFTVPLRQEEEEHPSLILPSFVDYLRKAGRISSAVKD